MRTTLFNSIYFYLVILSIGLPLWYKTTSPLRHSLPDVQMLMVHSQRILNQVRISVITAGQLESDNSIEDQKNILRNTLTQRFSNYINPRRNVAYHLDFHIRSPLQEEAAIFNQNISSLDEIDKSLANFQSTKGNIWIYLLSSKDLLKLTSKELANQDIIYGSARAIYVKVDDSLEQTQESIAQVLDTLLNGPKEMLDNQAESMRLLHRKLTINLNLIMQNSEDSNAFVSSSRYSDMRKLVETVFLKNSGIFSILDVELKSQLVQYAISSEFLNPNKDINALYDKSKVSQLINKVESRIAPLNAKRAVSLHIVIPLNGTTLHLVDRTIGKKGNIALTADKTCLMIWNEEYDFNLAFKRYVRLLLGLNEFQLDNTLNKQNFFSQWELDYVMRRVALAQLANSLSSLESVEKLLAKVGNIVIEQQVAAKIHESVQQSHESIDALEANRLENGFELSSKAYSNAETAFYDPSLLALLYFPEDQKYAIYFPLFLPVALQLLSDLNYFRKLILKKKETK